MAEVDLATGELRALAGRDFIEAIQEALDSCAVLVALIGRQWTTIADEQGRRRLDSPDDFVRAEVRTALDRGVRVIPVLVDRAKPPRQQELPAELHQLARLNAFDLSYDRFQYDAGQLLDLIQRELAAVRDQEEADRQAREVQPDGNSVGETAHEAPEPVQNDRTRAARPIADADVARLIADAERAAQSITSDPRMAPALTMVARALAATDPDRAVRVAQSITNEPWRAMALANIVGALAATDPDRAEHIAQSITEKEREASALADIVDVLAATDPDRAERIAQSITSEPWRASALAKVAETVAATDPDRAARLIADAERIAQSITDQITKVETLLKIANPTDRHRAQPPLPGELGAFRLLIRSYRD